MISSIVAKTNCFLTLNSTFTRRMISSIVAKTNCFLKTKLNFHPPHDLKHSCENELFFKTEAELFFKIKKEGRHSPPSSFPNQPHNNRTSRMWRRAQPFSIKITPLPWEMGRGEGITYT